MYFGLLNDIGGNLQARKIENTALLSAADMLSTCNHTEHIYTVGEVADARAHACLPSISGFLNRGSAKCR
jgi:hypothetical protein